MSTKAAGTSQLNDILGGAKTTADEKKQKELDALKAKIFVGKAKDLV
jgi:hypothetical protein